MDLKDLFSDSSRKTIDMGVATIGKNPEMFKKVLDFALEDDGAYSQRAGRVINLVAIIQPEMIRPYMQQLVLKLPTFKSGGLKRSIIKTISERSFDFDDETMGTLVNICFEWVNDSQEEIAIKAYAMDVLYSVSQFHPDLKPELIATFEHLKPEASAGIKVRCEKFLKKLYKEV